MVLVNSNSGVSPHINCLCILFASSLCSFSSFFLLFFSPSSLARYRFLTLLLLLVYHSRQIATSAQLSNHPTHTNWRKERRSNSTMEKTTPTTAHSPSPSQATISPQDTPVDVSAKSGMTDIESGIPTATDTEQEQTADEILAKEVETLPMRQLAPAFLG